MQVRVNTDRTIEGHEALVEETTAAVETALRRFAERITTVEVHLGDENSHKRGPDDKRCLLEVRMAGIQPLAVTELAPTTAKAVRGAADRMVGKIESALGRRGER